MAVQITLKNGDKVKPNDHVYCSPSWATRDGTPYSVARIMEFLPSADAPRGKGKGKEIYTRVRLAWYYRPGDVSDRVVADNRILLAAIYSEVAEITQLRARCHVIHRDKISDLAGWKKRPDRFYFTRLFDPYIKKEFEVIPSSAVQNVPPQVRANLIARYEYVVAEKETVPDLIDTIRLCGTCSEWCPNTEAVQCDRCKKYFHMVCVSPPLQAKPSRGYGWTCAPCARRHDDEVDKRGARQSTPNTPKPRTTVPASRGRGRPRKDRAQAEREENMEIKHFRMWPFRYVGQLTLAEDTLDEDDFIFPRTATRLGPKYQANVPSAPGPSTTPPSADLPDRGEDGTIETLSLVVNMNDEEVAEFEKCKDALATTKDMRSNIDFLTEATRQLTDAFAASSPMSVVTMKSNTRPQKWKKVDTRWMDREWSEHERAAFEDGISIHGAELRAVRDEVGTRSIFEVVRYYGHWKSAKLKAENSRIRNGVAVKKEDTGVISDEDEGSIVKAPTKGNAFCAACRTKESPTWYKAPKGLPTGILCDNCGMAWRKYADLNVRTSREEPAPVVKAKSIEANNKRDGTPLTAPPAKRPRTSVSVSAASTPPPPAPHVPQLRCVACRRNGPKGKVLKCQRCGFQCHAGCTGTVIEPAQIETWVCDVCENVKTLESSLSTDCILCPRIKPDRRRQVLNNADTFLRACKPTEGQNWVHVLCAVFAPETSFTDPARLRLVEGISAIPAARWAAECSICKVGGGAVTRCADCAREYHVSCAWKTGYRMGFELHPVKQRHRDSSTITFRGETGNMYPFVRCLHHNADKQPRDVYDLCDMDDNGETALEVYCKTQKRVQLDQSYGLLRKARRLDDLLNETGGRVANGDKDKGSAEPAVSPQCILCNTQYSPFFHPVPQRFENRVNTEQEWQCHRCHHFEEAAVGMPGAAALIKNFPLATGVAA